MDRFVDAGLTIAALCFFLASILAWILGHRDEAQQSLQTAVLISIWLSTRA